MDSYLKNSDLWKICIITDGQEKVIKYLWEFSVISLLAYISFNSHKESVYSFLQNKLFNEF